MSDRHGHHHHYVGHHAADGATRRLWIALVLTALFMLVEVVSGLLLGSLALISDAGHMLIDAGALGIALVAQKIAQRERSGAQTFGYRRAEILAAFINGIVLTASALWVIYEAVRRMGHAAPIMGGPMFAVATVGLVINLTCALVLAGAGQSANLNVRAALAHILADAAGSVAAMVAAVLIWTLAWYWADAVASILISIVILWGAWGLVRRAAHVLMESVPAGLDSQLLHRTILETAGVASYHDLHVWTISEGFAVVTVHVVLRENYHGTEVAARVAGRVQTATGIAHVTVQPEPPVAPLVPAETLTTGRNK